MNSCQCISKLHPLLSRHGLSHAKGPHLIGLLTQGTPGTEKHLQYIHAISVWDPPLLSHLLSDISPADNVSDRHEHDQTAAAAVVPDLLSDLAGHVAGDQKGADADSTVFEAAKQTVLKLTGHVEWFM